MTAPPIEPIEPPIEPPPSSFAFPPAHDADEKGRVVVGGDLQPGTLLAAYRGGLFPMRLTTGELAWWSPDPRGVLPVQALRVTRSLRRSMRRFEITVDTAFREVVVACAARPPGEYEWITAEVIEAYNELHRLGWAHSVEAWCDGQLAGGLYGVAIGGFFSGESMFQRERDASKVALVALVEILAAASPDGGADRIVDVQWLTPHLASLGAVSIARDEYLRRLDVALGLPGAFPASGGRGTSPP